VYRIDGRQRKESAATFREAREIKLRRAAEAACDAAGPTLHSYALDWVGNYAGRGANDVINDRTRREYRRLLVKYALAYFARDERLRDIDERRARGSVDWLCRLTDEDGHRLGDRSIRNVVLPLQSCLGHAAQAGLLVGRAEPVVLLPRRRRGRGSSSTSVVSSRTSNWRRCWPRYQTGGGPSSRCWPRLGCAYLRRSRCG
jgi:hypothetical protein